MRIRVFHAYWVAVAVTLILIVAGFILAPVFALLVFGLVVLAVAGYVGWYSLQAKFRAWEYNRAKRQQDTRPEVERRRWQGTGQRRHHD